MYKLHRDYEVHSDSIVSGEKRSTIELSEFANDVFGKREQWSLQGLAEFLLGCSLRKDTSVRISKWSSDVLSMQQIDYAACDAFASLLLFHKINNHKKRMLQPSVFLQAE
ncbi:Werner syndrome ATP-dependent helicase-like isoform X1 [Leptotrombidium deliense]|uniref:3'-5' exonuclease n=1 Tax=Leptotrombidium deliense TaxID=299467 RepID=A0A443S364_9ACAR|nr:Werner syndrome ATP-dependent helicase-like isoform X1 [Leptotrombidium deliense]